jgi:HSP20 family protein
MFEDMDNIFTEMRDLMSRDLDELSEKAPEDLVREKTLPDGGKVKEWGPFVYGYSMTVGPDGKPQIREFGNIKPETRMGRHHLDVKDKREPLADVRTTNGEVQVIVELPGVAKEEIDLRGTEKSLTISVDTPKRKYHKELQLPVPVDLKKVKSKFTNGVLEVTIKKKEKKEKPKGERIKIE